MRSARFYVTVSITCSKDEDWFLTSFEELPESEQNIIIARNGVPCSGTGTMGNWCYGCPFVEKYEQDYINK